MKNIKQNELETKMKITQTTSLPARLMALAALATTIIISPTWANADEAEQRGYEIAAEATKRDTGFVDFKVNLEMVLRNKHNQQSTRSMRNTTREQANDGDKTLVVFDSPRDVKGTAFLSHTHKADSDDQWLYLPALKRVKRISSSNKSGPFMGSEFAYEDIASQELEKYTYRYAGDDSLDGRDHFMVEAFPVHPKSGYSRQVVWFDKAEYRVWKTDFYDRGNELMKTLTYKNYEQYLGKFWRAGQLDMVNHKTGKSTSLIFSDYHFGVGTNERDFTSSRLKRAL